MFGDPRGDEPQDRLAKRLIDAGISVYDPDPAAALKVLPAAIERFADSTVESYKAQRK
jgi:hypothetical protein